MDRTTISNRQKVLEKLSQVNLPNGLQPRWAPDYSPVGQIYFFTLQSTNPNYDVMELKTLQDWVIVKQLKSVPDVVDVSIFGGATREYQVQVDPEQADLLRAEHRAGGAGAREQQRQRRRQLHRARGAGDQRPSGGTGANPRTTSAPSCSRRRTGFRCACAISATVAAGAQDPAGPARQGDSSRAGQGGGRSGRGIRHRAAAQGRRRGQRADGAAREGRFPQQSFPAAGREDRSRTWIAATWCT